MVNTDFTTVNSSPLKIRKEDFLRLPPQFRNLSDGIKVWANAGPGREAFVPVEII